MTKNNQFSAFLLLSFFSNLISYAMENADKIPKLKTLCYQYCIQNNIPPTNVPKELEEIIEKSQKSAELFKKKISKKELMQEFMHGVLDPDARWKNRGNRLAADYNEWAQSQVEQVKDVYVPIIEQYPNIVIDLAMNARREREQYLLKKKRIFRAGCICSLCCGLTFIGAIIIIINTTTSSKS